MTGYFLVKRGLFEHRLFKSNQPLSEREAWLWLIERANFTESEYRFKMQMHAIPRGSLAGSYRTLAGAWKWSPNRVIRVLNLFEKEQMVVVNTEHGFVLITIRNYDFYQTPWNTDGTVAERKRNTDGTATDTNLIKVIKEKKVIKEIYTAEFEELWLAYPKKESKFAAAKAYHTAIKQGVEHGRVIDGVRAFAEQIKRNRVAGKYIPHGATWLNDRRWDDSYADDATPERGGVAGRRQPGVRESRWDAPYEGTLAAIERGEI